MSKEIAQQWLQASATTLNNKNLVGHLDLISKKVSLTGIPGFDNIDYDAWSSQCQHEFENNLVRNAEYQGLKLLAGSEDRVMFKTLETIEATDGTRVSQGIEVLIEKEADGTWRVIQERVLDDDESRHDGLI